MSKMLEVHGLRNVYQGRGRSVEALADLTFPVEAGELVCVGPPGLAVVFQAELAVDLPDERDQLTTRSDPRFTRLRSHVYAQIQQAKRGGGQAAAPPGSPEGAAAAPGG